MDGLKILQINLAKNKQANLLLTNYAITNKIDIILFQDATFDSNKSFNSSWPTIISKLGCSGIAVVNSDLTFNTIITTNHSIFINILSDSENITIGSIYSPPSSNFSEDMDEWVPFLPASNKFLLGGDFNAHSVLWGYNRSNNRGEVLMNIINNKSLTILNDPNSILTFQSYIRLGTPSQQSILTGRPDLTICSQNLTSLIEEWSVDPIFNASDHNYIIIKIKQPITINKSYRYKSKHFKPSKFNNPAKNFLQLQNHKMQNLNAPTKIDNFIQKFTTSINKICNNSFRKKNIYSKITKLNWWTTDLTIERNKLTAMRRRYIKNTLQTRT